jgi:phage terminase large subunit-like protein
VASKLTAKDYGYRQYLYQSYRLSDQDEVSSDLLPIPSTWLEFAQICKIRSGDGIVFFNPYEYQRKLIEQIERHPTTVITKTRQLGITETVINYFLFKALRNPGYLCVVFSKSQSDTSNIAKRLRRTIEFLYKYCETKTDSLTDIEFKNGGRILFRNSTPNGARGLESVSDILFDESAFVEEIEEIYKASIPCTTMMGERAKIIILSTPNGQSGWYWDKLANNNNNKDILEICEQIKAEQIEPCQYWTDSSGWCKFILHWLDHPKFKLKKTTYIDDLIKQYGAPRETIEQEYNLSFTSAESIVFDNDLIRSINTGAWEKDEVDPDGSYYIGIDTSLLGLDYCVATVLKSKDNKLYLVDMYRKRKQTNDVHIYQLSELIQKYAPVAVGIEVNSGGQIYYEQLVKSNINTVFEAIKTTAVSKPVYINRLLLSMEQQILILPNDRTVIEELLSFRNNDGKLGAIAGRHDDIVMSLAFALTLTPNLL